jgi:hypothetical protein
VSELSDSVSACCDAFRLGREAEASTLFDQFLSEVTDRINSDPQLMNEAFQRSLAIALSCQQNRDWIGLADEVEFSIAVLLER